MCFGCVCQESEPKSNLFFSLTDPKVFMTFVNKKTEGKKQQLLAISEIQILRLRYFLAIR